MLQNIKEDFPILQRLINSKPLVYLDSAATSQKPRQVIQAIVNYYEKYNANVHRGIYTISEEATFFYEEARSKIASFINAKKEEIVFTRNTTEAINLIAYTWALHNLQEDDEIILTEMEHHSNLVPWQIISKIKKANLKFVPFNEEGILVISDLEKLLTKRTKIVAICHQSNVLGTVNPVQQVSKMAHSVGAIVVVDGAQSVPHMEVNVQELGCDFLAFSAHKMCGPTGIGALYGRYELLESMPAFQGGGEMIQLVNLQHSTYKDPPWKFEAGTPNIAGAIGWAAAIDYLSKIGMKNIQTHEKELIHYALKCLSEIKGLKIYGPLNNRGGVIAFNLDGVHPHDVAQVLDSESICIRAGHHCAQPLHKRLEQFGQLPSGFSATCRASFYLYNTRDDIDELIYGLDKVRKLFKII